MKTITTPLIQITPGAAVTPWQPAPFTDAHPRAALLNLVAREGERKEAAKERISRALALIESGLDDLEAEARNPDSAVVPHESCLYKISSRVDLLLARIVNVG